jgi:hypothetical protein
MEDKKTCNTLYSRVIDKRAVLARAVGCHTCRGYTLRGVFFSQWGVEP